MSERNGGEWTSARYAGFVKSVLRAGSLKWPPRWQVLNEGKVGKRINKTTGRLAEHYTCNRCKGVFPAKEIQVDHILEVVDPHTGFTTWDSVIERMYCEKEGLQLLCKTCHKIKTAEVKLERKQSTK